MIRLFLLWMALASPGSEARWQDLVFEIFPDPDVSSDTATLCRVRVVNHGASTWAGQQIRFEAEALKAGTVVERARGRFGLSLGPHEALETIIGFSGKYREFRVRPLSGTDAGHHARSRIRKRIPGRGGRRGTPRSRPAASRLPRPG